jgi:hypothetical protein
MDILLTLDSGMGANLGPNFNLTSNSGHTVTPNTATRAELIAGKMVSISPDGAVNVFVTSTGACTNVLVINIAGITTSTTSTSTSTSTTGAPTTSTTSTSTTSTSTSTSTTTLAPIPVTLAYSNVDGPTACYKFTAPIPDTSTYYLLPGTTLADGYSLYVDGIYTNIVADGFYSNGVDYWEVNVAASGGVLSNGTPCPQTTTTTTSTSTTSTSTSTTSTSTSTSTTTAAPTSTSTSTSTSTTTVPLPPGDTSTTTTSTTEPPTTTTTTTTEPPTTTTTSTSTSTSTSTTTAIPTYTYLGKSSPNSGNSLDACTSYSTIRGYISLKSNLSLIVVGDIIYDTYSSTPTNGGDNWIALKSGGVGDAYSFQINTSGQVIQVGGNCSGATTTSTTSTSTSSTTSTTTSGGGGTTTSTSTSTTTVPTNVTIFITNGSLDVTITDVTINGTTITWTGGGDGFPVPAGENGNFTSTQLGTKDVIIYYDGHIPGQNMVFTDSNSTVTCQTLNGSSGTFTIAGATITGGVDISIEVADGVC